MVKARRKRRTLDRGPSSAPAGLVAIGFLGVLAFAVGRRVDDIQEVRLAGGGIVFREPSAANALSVDELRERSSHVEVELEQRVHAVEPSTAPAAADISGTWSTPDRVASWQVSFENGLFVFRERPAERPDTLTAAGFGTFDGQRWSLQMHTVLGAAGHGTLHLTAAGTLEGQLELGDERFDVELQR